MAGLPFGSCYGRAVAGLPFVSATGVEPKAPVGPSTVPNAPVGILIVSWLGSVLPIGSPGRAAGTLPNAG